MNRHPHRQFRHDIKPDDAKLNVVVGDTAGDVIVEVAITIILEPVRKVVNRLQIRENWALFAPICARTPTFRTGS